MIREKEITNANIREINEPGYTKKLMAKNRHNATCAKNRKKRKRKSN